MYYKVIHDWVYDKRFRTSYKVRVLYPNTSVYWYGERKNNNYNAHYFKKVERLYKMKVKNEKSHI